MKLVFPAILSALLLAGCTGNNDEPTPDPFTERTLVRREMIGLRKQPDGQWLKSTEGFEYNFTYNATGALASIESDDPDLNARRHTLVYDQGRFTGITHRYLDWNFTFGNGRLRSLLAEYPGGPTGTTKSLHHLHYRSDGKIDSIVTKRLDVDYLHSKTVFVWNGDDLAARELYWLEDNGYNLAITEAYTYENRTLPFKYSALPEGVEFFLLHQVFHYEWYFLSKRLVRSRVVTQVAINHREVTNWTHRLDDKGRLTESLQETVEYDSDDVPTREERTSHVFSYAR